MLTFLKKNYLLIAILLTAFLVRVYGFSFPYFSSEEVRVAFRGYAIATSGKDELGRFFPVLFNSLDDYQLPMVSYLTAGGELVFGKTEAGVRMPFILLGTLIIFLIFQIAKFFSKDKTFAILSALVAAFSPGLIFLSKIPNEAIVLITVLSLLFYLLIYNKSIFIIVPVMIFSLLTSKLSWFILFPLTLFTVVFYLNGITRKKKLIIVIVSALLSVFSFSIFFTVPQAQRSLLENNFSLFSDITVKNGIDKLRGQGIESGWPPQLSRLLFNKSFFLIVGVVHWLSHLNPAIYFGQFDSEGLMNFSFLGAFAKVILIPALIGIFAIIRRGDRKIILLAGILLILTYPAMFIYPGLTLELSVLILPFFSLIIAYGLIEVRKFNNNAFILIFVLVIFELSLNFYNFSIEEKNTNGDRPGWVKSIAVEIAKSSEKGKIAVSDDIVMDIVPYINWYATEKIQTNRFDIPWPYKVRQYSLPNITIIGSEGKFRSCGLNENLNIFASLRDVGKIQKDSLQNYGKSFSDYLGKERVFLYINKICLN